MHDPLVAFGQNLRRERRRKGFSQERLALEAEVHRTHISKIERALCEPGVRTVARMLAVLKIDGGPLFESTEAAAGEHAR